LRGFSFGDNVGNTGLQGGTGGPVNIGGTGSGGTVVNLGWAGSFTGNAQGGTSTPFPTMGPGLISNCALFVGA